MGELDRDEYRTHVWVSAIIATLSLIGVFTLPDMLNLPLSLFALPYIVLCIVSGYYMAKDKHRLQTHYEDQVLSELKIIDDDEASIGVEAFAIAFTNILMVSLVGYMHLDDRRKLTVQNGHLLPAYEQGKQLFLEAKSSADNGEYEEAIADSQEAWEELETLNVDIEEINSFQEEISEAETGWRAKVVEQSLSAAESAAQEEDLERSVKHARKAVERTEEIVRDSYIPEKSANSARDLHKRAQKARVVQTTQWIETLLSEAETAADDDDYERAIELATQAIEQATKAREISEETTSVDHSEVGDPPFEDLHNRGRTDIFEWSVERIESRLAEAEVTAQEGDYERAIELATQVTEEATKAQERTEELTSIDQLGTTDSTFEELHNRGQTAIFEWSLGLIESQLEDAESVAETGDYQRAADMATAAVEIAPQLLEPVDGDAFDRDSYESLRERAKEHSTDWERQWLVTRINNVQSQDLADYERTKTKFEDILTALSETEALSGRELELLEEEAYTTYAQTLKSHAEQSLATGKEHAADGDHEAALEAFEEVAFETNATLEKIQEWEIGKVDEITQIQKDLSHRYVASRIASVESQIKIGIKQFSAEKYETARDTFSEATEFAEQAVNETQDESENEQLLGLLNIAEDNADAARRAVLGIGDATPQIHKVKTDLSSDTAVAGYDSSVGKSGSATVGSRQVNTAGGPPAVNPVAPDIDVAYTAITKGDQIGQGGDADVFRATVEVDGESYQVAFKRPRSSGTVHTDRLDRFVNEAETWAKLDDHDHIVGVVDWDTTPIPWILLEYMDGGDLSEYAGTLDLEQSIWIAQCVAEGVSHAHSRGIAHLDLKPENILFRTTGPETYPVPKVADWGLSKAILHDEGEMDGFSPQYAAPEQVDTDRFGTPDQATDLYQLGAVFYDLFVGHPPYEGDIDAVLTSIVDEEVVPPSEANSDLPKAIDGAILTALEKEKRDRYESVLYLRDALAEVSDSTMP